MTDTISIRRARRIALAAQGFGSRALEQVGKRQLNSTIRRLGLLQIDSVNVFERSHYLPVFARLGSYDKAELDALTLNKRGPYLEYWAHEAALIPREWWPLFRWRMEDFRDRENWSQWSRQHASTLDWIKQELAEKGPMAASEFEHEDNRRSGPWWGWSDIKTGLEALFANGEVISAGRKRFERVYGLASELLPQEILHREVSRADAQRELVGHAARALGIATESDIADYFRFKKVKVADLLGELESEGLVRKVSVEGWKQPAWIHTQARIPRKIEAAAFLSPFDPVVWERKRALRLFDFHYRIEIYTPAPKRIFGYYSLPILVDDKIVGRIDLKSDRRARILRVQSAWTEDHADPKVIAERIAPLLERTAAWQGLESVSVANWGDLTPAIAAELRLPLLPRS